MTADERREYTQKKCDAYNSAEGHMHEKDGYECILCKNRGYISVVLETEREGRENDYSEAVKECVCMPVRASIMRLRKSGLEGMTEKHTFAAYKTPEAWQKNIKDKALKFLQDGGRVFFIGGQSGGGKTHICVAIVSELMRRKKKEVRYMLWQDEVIKLKASVMDERNYQSMMNAWKRVPVLYIDDFLKPIGEQEKPSAADARTAYEIINHRYNNADLITVISSERLIGEILDIDEATGGRLVEYTGEYMINISRDRGRNYRLRNIGMI